MNRIFKRSSDPTQATGLKSLENYKQKTLHALLLGFAVIAVAILVVIFALRFANLTLLSNQDQLFFIICSAVVLLGILGIAFLEKYLSFETASLLFNLLVIVGILVSDSPQGLVHGRSLIALLLPVVLASVLLRPWAGMVVAAFFTAFIAGVHIFLHLGVPNLPGILILFLVAVIIQQATSNLEHALAQELKNSRSLVESQDLFQKVIASFPYAIFIVNLAGNITDCNTAAVKMLGISSKQELLGKRGTTLVHPEEQASISGFNKQLLNLGAFKRTGYKSLRNDGSTFIADISAATILDWEGKPASYVFMLQDVTERLQAESALRASEEKFAKTFQFTPVPMAISGMDGRYIEINQAFAQTMGYPPEEIIGHTPSELGIFVDPEQNQKAIQILKNQGTLHNYEMPVRTRSGEILSGVFFAEPLQLNERPLMLTLMDNITERKWMEYELRESEEKYRRMIDTLPIGVIVHQEGIVQLINPTGARFLGAETPQAILGKSNLDFIHPDYLDLVQKRVRDALIDDKYGEPIEEKLKRIDGTFFDAEVATLPIKYMNKASVLAMFQDITERKKADAELRKSEENFRNLSENTADGILIGAPDGRHIYANRQACELLGYSAEEILQTSQFNISDPAAYSILKKNLKDRIAGRPLPKRYETTLRRKDGTIFPVEISGTRTVWQDLTCDLVIFRDITESRQAREAIRSQSQRIQEVSRQLVEVQERERRMLASELHDDLGQSLTSLKLMLELASSSRPSNKQQKVMGDSLDLVSELMGKVRNLSLDLRPAMLDDFGLFTALRWLFERFQIQTGIVIQCNYDLDSDQRFSPAIETAAFRIIQEALTNIARHAEVWEAQVNLEIGDNLSIEIVDQGTGFGNLKENQHPADSVGLSGMQERARLLGGQVEIVSEIGVGTRVIASIPLAGGEQ